MERFYKDEPKAKSGENPVIAYCDHCGFAIYAADDALIVKETEDIIHSDCWEEYAEEHMFDFVQKASDSDWFGRELS